VRGPCSHQHRGGSGEPLVLVHGIGSSWRAFTPILRSLEARHDVLAVSLPGYGDSPALPGEPSVPALADAVEAELDVAGFDAPHVVGNSLGGWIAAELARRGRARSVVGLSPAGLWTPRELAYANRSLRTTLRVARALAPHADRLMRSAPLRAAAFGQVAARGWRIEPDEAAYALRTLADSPSFERTLAWINAGDRRVEGLTDLRVPLLVAWGTRDLLLPLRQARRWTALVPDSELRVLPGLGHLPMVDDPELVARTILEFTARPGVRAAA
jgi:pimeloyl-ACP methyl ester carboxylesterase